MDQGKRSQLILGISAGAHDTAAALYEDYDIKAAVSLERLTRRKNDRADFPDLCIDEVLAIAGATRADVDVIAIGRRYFPNEFFRLNTVAGRLQQWFRTNIRKKNSRNMMREVRVGKTSAADLLDAPAFVAHHGFRPDTAMFFYNHHEAHALPTLFYTDWPEALLVTADGGGDNVNYSFRTFSNGQLQTLYGGSECDHTPLPVDSIGEFYSAVTEALGFVPARHEGKITGLAAFGTPVLYDEMAKHYRVDPGSGRIQSDFTDHRAVLPYVRKILQGVSREDAAASVQRLTEKLMIESLRHWVARYPTKHIGLAGGVFANVSVNRLIAEQLGLEEIFVFPAMGDEGLAAGGPIVYLHERDGLAHWLGQRRRLKDVYLGRDFGDAIDGELTARPEVARIHGPAVEGAAQRLAAGQLGAIYTNRMEFGPRALGARTILANPARRETHDLLNTRLNRTEFMPFAPVIQAGKAEQVFGVSRVNAYACKFMTTTCDVRPEWRSRIPAVVHLDGSARPQIVERHTNPLYFDILTAFEAATGLPVLVNTSFNVHEEPIVNSPKECVRALLDGRIDFVVTERGLYERRNQAGMV
ncbi:MAG: hypothetical protein JOZ70_15980 [Pseudolabrys sp.]|nr:hypothetical protein [Pseudolabrys sp.]